MPVRQHQGNAQRGNHNEGADNAGGDGATLGGAVGPVGLREDGDGRGAGGGDDEGAGDTGFVRFLLELGEALAQACGRRWPQEVRFM